MKPDIDLPWTPFSFDGVATWLCPNLWDETKHVPFRGALFVLSYSASTIFFFSVVMVPVGLLVSVPLMTTLAIALIPGTWFGIAMGLLSGWHFRRKVHKSRQP